MFFRIFGTLLLNLWGKEEASYLVALSLEVNMANS